MPLIDYGIRQRSFPRNPGAPNRLLPSKVHGRRVVYPSSKPVLERVQIQAEPSRHDAKTMPWDHPSVRELDFTIHKNV